MPHVESALAKSGAEEGLIVDTDERLEAMLPLAKSDVWDRAKWVRSRACSSAVPR